MEYVPDQQIKFMDTKPNVNKIIFNLNYPEGYLELVKTLQKSPAGEYQWVFYNSRVYNVFLQSDGQFLVVRNIFNNELDNGIDVNVYEAIKKADLSYLANKQS